MFAGSATLQIRLSVGHLQWDLTIELVPRECRRRSRHLTAGVGAPPPGVGPLTQYRG